MAGLLDLMGLGGGLQKAMSGGTPGINPAAPDPYYQMFGIDPAELKREQVRRSLLAISSGLLSGQNWAQGAGRAFQGIAEARGGVEEDAFRKGMLGLQYQQMKKSLDPAPGWETLDPNEAAQIGLPPDRIWQRSPSGEIKEAYKPDKPEESKPLFQDFVAPGGVKIPRVSYDDGRTWQDMTLGGPQGQGGGMQPFDAILSNETGGLADPDRAVSSAGAVGRAQMLPGTFTQMATEVGIPPRFRNMRSAGQSRALGKRYYGQQQQTFGDDVLAAGAYHAGPGNFRAYLTKAGYQPGMATDDLIQRMEPFAPKTADYMRKFMGKTGGVQQADYSQYVDQGGDEPLVQVADPSSPTGIKWVKRSEAAGAAGVPPAAAETLINKDKLAFREKQVAVDQTAKMADSIIQKIQTTPVGATGSIVRTVEGLGQQAKQLVKVFGDPINLNPSQYNLPTSVAAASAGLQSDIMGLAYTMARAQSGGGVLSNQDVQNALDRIGAAGLLTSPDQMSSALTSIVTSLRDNLETERTVKGFQYESGYSGGQMSGASPAGDVKSGLASKYGVTLE